MKIAVRKMNMPRFKGFHFEHLRAPNARTQAAAAVRSVRNTDERNSTPIVEEHVRNKRRRFTTREIYLLSPGRVYISTRKNERGWRIHPGVADDTLSFVTQRVKGLTSRAAAAAAAAGVDSMRSA